MARFYGEIGYVTPTESPAGSGNWKDVVTEYSYFGDVLRSTVKINEGEQLTLEPTVGNSISVLADKKAIEHISKIRYIRWDGELWTVTNVEVRAPRLVLSLGSVYNGPTP